MSLWKSTKAFLYIMTDADTPEDHVARLASFFAEKGFVTFTQAVTPQNYMEDIDVHRKLLSADYPELPLFLYAEGNATYPVRAYLTERGDGINGVVLAGTGYVSPGAGSLKVYGGKLRALFGGEGRRENESDARALQQLKAEVSIETHFPRLPKNLSVLLVSGAEDPEGDRGTGVRRVQEGMLTSGMTDITCKLYPDVKDDLFVPEIADTFLADLEAFFDARLDGKNASSYAFNRAYEEKKLAEKKDYEIDQILI